MVLARYRAAVDRKRDLDPNFVVIAQCYAGEAADSELETTLHRLRLYKEVGGVDWVQFTAPRSVHEVQRARQTVTGPFSIMQGFLHPPLTNDDLLALGITIAWMPRPTHMVIQAALYDYVQDFMHRGTAATEAFTTRHQANPYVNGRLRVGGAQVALQRALEEQYLAPEALAKYQRAQGTRPSRPGPD